MGGKTTTSSQQVQIPPAVLARYNSVNATAEQAASAPFQQYSTNPNAFVAPLTDTQEAGIAGTNAYANTAQPYFNAATGELTAAQNATTPQFATAGSDITSGLASAQPYNAGATGLALAGAGAVNPTNLGADQINQYISPYLNTVLGSTASLLNQNNQQQQAGQLGNAINQGAFGGDRAGIAAANLEQQQNLANANIYSGIANQGYNVGLSTAQQQQELGLGAAQANRAALQNASSQLLGIGQTQFGQGLGAAQAEQALAEGQYGVGANTAQALGTLGTGAQAAGLQGAQAQLAAGQAQQQTEQAGKTALYNQFLQQQSYPFQVAQFLANIAEGTGALSGSTTTTTQPGGFISDKRLKEDIEPIGKTYDGQNIVAFRYKGDPRKQIGLLAQDVEKKHPDAVGLASGFKTVDYDKATRDAADRGHFRRGGLALAANDNDEARRRYASGGMPLSSTYPALPGQWPGDIGAILAAQAEMYAPYGSSGLYGAAASGAPRGGSSYVPAASLPVGHLAVASGLSGASPSPLQQATQVADFVNKDVSPIANWAKKHWSAPPPSDSAPDTGADDSASDDVPFARGGGLGTRLRRDDGGDVGGWDSNDQVDYGKTTDQAPPPATAKIASFTPETFKGPSAPAATATGLAIPNDNPKASLTLPGALPPPQKSPFMQLLDLGTQVAGDFAKAGAKSGGRQGYDDGGSVDDGDPTGLATAMFGPGTDTKQPTPPPKPIMPAKAPPGAIDLGPLMSVLGDPIGAGMKAGEGLVHSAFGAMADNPDIASAYEGSGATGLGGAGAGLAMVNDRDPAPTHGPAYTQGPPIHLTGGRPVHRAAPRPAGPSPASQAATAMGQGLASATQGPEATAGVGAVTPMDTDPILDPALTAPARMQQGRPSDSAPSPDQTGLGAASGAGAPNQGGWRGMASDAANGIGGYLSRALHGNPQELMPLLAGIAAMGTAPTVHPGVALAAGLGGFSQSYMSTQQGLAQRALTQAHTGVEQTVAYEDMQRTAPEGTQAVPGPDPSGDPAKSFTGPDGRPWHYQLKVGYANFGAPGATPPAGAAAAQTGTKRGPLSTDYQSGAYSLGPSSDTDAYMADKYKVDPTQPGIANHSRMLAMNPALGQQEAQATQSAQARIGDQAATDATHRQLVQLSSAINDLSPTGFAGTGEDFEDRMHLLNVYNTYAGMLGIPADPTVTNALKNSQIIDKIRTLTGSALANQFGERAANIAHGLSAVLPGGGIQQSASDEMLATMLVQNQQARDFANYRNAYIARYGTDLGVEQRFQADMGPVYDREQPQLAKAMRRGPKTGMSAAEAVAANPGRAKTYEHGYTRADGTVVPGYGDGASRYWR